MHLACWVLLIAFLITQVMFLVESDDFENYDIDLNNFEVECGSVESPAMAVTYSGFVEAVYSPTEPPSCQAVQVVQGIYFIADALTQDDCPVQVFESPHVSTLDLVVQSRRSHRLVTDPTYRITCSYELAGTQSSSVQHFPQDGMVNRHPEWNGPEGLDSESELVLGVYNTAGVEIEEADLGAYIQLRAFLTSVDGEPSAKMWNCRVFHEDEDYYILMNGCGDGDVISSNRGFYTSTGTAPVSRIIRSAYFQAFSLPSSDQVQFECKYLVCQLSTQCDGRSCSSQRRRRATSTSGGSAWNDSINLPSVVSKPIHIKKNSEHVFYGLPDIDTGGVVDSYPGESLPGMLVPAHGAARERPGKSSDPWQDSASHPIFPYMNELTVCVSFVGVTLCAVVLISAECRYRRLLTQIDRSPERPSEDSVQGAPSPPETTPEQRPLRQPLLFGFHMTPSSAFMARPGTPSGGLDI